MNQRITVVQEKWKGLSVPVKIAVGTVALALVLFLFIMFMLPSKYTMLYSQLEESDRVAIEKYLSSNNIDYTFDEATNSINIAGDVLQVKKDLAMEGLPAGGSAGGLSSFSEMSIGSTQYDKNVQYQAAMQEELNSSLVEMFPAISSADVKIPLTENKSIFDDEPTDVTVSVALKIRDGYKLEANQVKAIQIFVAGALNDVTAENVQVVDQDLNPLSSEETGESTSSKQRQIKDETKNKLESQLESVLSEVYGKVKVIVNVDINFDEIIQNVTSYNPEGTVISREEDTEKKSNLQGSGISATVGTDENGEVPRYELEGADSAEALSTEEKHNIIENFVVGETVEKIIKSPELRNVNVSVWFDDTSLTQMDLYDAEEMIAVASGLTGEVKRASNDKGIYENGSVKVIKKKFTEEEKVPEVQTTTEETDSKVLYMVIGGLAILLVAVVIFVVLRTRKTREETIIEEEEIIENLATVEELNEGEIEEELNEEEEEVVEAEEIETAALLATENIEWNEERASLRKLTDDVAKKFPKETADVISRLLRKK